MIQRIQTIFLLLVTIVSALLLFVPFVRYNSTPAPVEVSLMPVAANGAISSMIYIPVAINLLIFVLSVYIIMQYKRRIFQMKMTNLLMALSTILLGVMLLFEYVNPAVAGTQTPKDYLWGAYLPIISVIASFLASRYIKKDEELVRSADRLR
jgi:hypothetical protein